MTSTRVFAFASVLLVMGGRCVMAQAPAPSTESAEFFEKHVRPVLAERCVGCHGSESQEAGLRLDSGTMALAGGSTGPVIVPGDPDKSRLVEVVTYERDIQMPPDGKLPAAQIEALKNWVKLGAAWPQSTESAAASGADRGQADAATTTSATHWAFQPIEQPTQPSVRDAAWPANELDYFVLAELEKNGLTPSPAASRSVLIRRANFDLIGLPPTKSEIDAFVHDSAPDAFAKVVDRLLAAPEYGQRWARHWLDVARYADTKGYVFTEDTRYPYSYTYRDYVIRACNEDLPYDRFISEQLAADLLPHGEDQRSLAALGFLTLGSRFMNNVNDQIDDRIDVTMRGLLGLTVTCARCHDHKFDPIPMADYYSLYGIFASAVEPADQPLVAMPEENAAYLAHQKELATRQQALDALISAQQRQIRDGLRSRVADYLVRVVTTQPPQASEQPMFSLNPDDIKPEAVERWRSYLAETGKAHHSVFAPWHALASLTPEEFATRANQAIAALPTEAVAGSPPAINARVKEALGKSPVTSMVEVAQRYGDLLSSIEREWLDAQAAASAAGMPAPTAHSTPAGEELRQVLYAEQTPTAINTDDTTKLFDRTAANEYGRLRRALDDCKVSSPAEPPRAMSLVDSPTPVEPHIFLRGNANRPGPSVPRQFIKVLAGENRQPFQKGSGRLELAAAITDRANPLTARVMANRVWLHHFGSALVNTPSDFGVRSDPPTNPDLLNYLAASFRDEGWSLKKLHRKLLLSATYQQASDDRPEALARDPENRLYWKMNRRRLEFEAMRDSLLAVAGRLDRSLSGRPVNLLSQPYTARRTVYGFVDRGDLPGLYRAFDFASPESSSPERPRTTVPQQALFLMNSPFVLEQAKNVVARADVSDKTESSVRVHALYETVLGRSPTPQEVHEVLDFVSGAPTGNETAAWQELAQVLMLTNEFIFVD